VGLVVPGTSFMIVAGILSSQGVWDLGDLVTAVILGGIIGDGISFYLGKRGTLIFKEKNKIFKFEYLQKGEQFFLKHGEKSIFFARFFGPLRPIIPFVAGFFKMSSKRFFLFNILSAILWAPFYILIGYFFGQASVHFEKIIGRIGFFSVGLIVVLGALFFFKHSILKKGQEFFDSLRSFVSSIFVFILTRPRIKLFLEQHPRAVGFLKRRINKQSIKGLPLTLGVITILVLLFSIGGIISHLILSPTVLKNDLRVQEWLFLHRHTMWVNIFWTITYLGSSIVIVPIVAVSSILFLLKKKYEYLLSFFVVVAGSSLMVYIIKVATTRPRPFGVAVYTEHLFSFPSLHTSIAVVVYGFLGYWLIQQTKNWKTKLNIVFVQTILILIVGFSRLYLGVHFLSDVVVGYILGVLWLWIGISLVRVLRIRHFE
jgi:undecaprenyl-diphosphatase